MLKRARGAHPVYFQDPMLDRFLTVLMTLAEEVSVLRERLDTVERIAASKGLVTPEEIEAYQPDEQVAAEREEQRTAYVERLLRVFIEEAEQTEPAEATYEDVVTAVS
jgi:hypothetical protein